MAEGSNVTGNGLLYFDVSILSIHESASNGICWRLCEGVAFLPANLLKPDMLDLALLLLLVSKFD